MEWGTVIALVIAVPFLLFPVALIWYITGGGIYQAIRRAREKRYVSRSQSPRSSASRPRRERVPRPREHPAGTVGGSPAAMPRRAR